MTVCNTESGPHLGWGWGGETNIMRHRQTKCTYLQNESAVEDEGADTDVTETVYVPEEGEGECHQQGQHQQHHCTEDTRRLPKEDETVNVIL